jgi:thiol-disulfide isomerase/thioredoxin
MKWIVVMVFMGLFAQVEAQAPKKGQVAPQIELPDAQGMPLALSSLRGKIVLIDCWASWCGPWRRANKSMLPIYQQYQSKGFEIYGISLDDSATEWLNAVAADKIQWKQVREAGGWNAPISTAWRIAQIPTTFLLDQQGVVVAIDPSPEQVRTYLRKHL